MRLYVGNVSYRSNEESLRGFFASYGPITSVHLPLDRETGKGRGFAFVEIENAELAKKAMEELNGKELDGRALRIRKAREQSSDRGGSRPPRRGQFGDRN